MAWRTPAGRPALCGRLGCSIAAGTAGLLGDHEGQQHSLDIAPRFISAVHGVWARSRDDRLSLQRRCCDFREVLPHTACAMCTLRSQDASSQHAELGWNCHIAQ